MVALKIFKKTKKDKCMIDIYNNDKVNGFTDENTGKYVFRIGQVTDVASSLVEWLEIMHESKTHGFEVVCGDIDTRTAVGAIMRDFMYGLFKFNESTFGMRSV